MIESEYIFEVLCEGQRLDENVSDGRVVWVAGRRGCNFQLRVENRSDGRIMASCSVDGLSVMTGELPNGKGRGYIVKAHSTLIIPGWRLDEENVAQFEFTDKAKSYATQVGQKNEKQGYLSCSIYREKVIPPELPKRVEIAEVEGDFAGEHLFSPKGMLFSQPADIPESGIDKKIDLLDLLDDSASDNIGVGFGKKTEHRSKSVSFQIDHTIPPVTLSLRYDTARGLQNRGIGCAIPLGWDSSAFEPPKVNQKVPLARDSKGTKSQLMPVVILLLFVLAGASYYLGVHTPYEREVSERVRLAEVAQLEAEAKEARSFEARKAAEEVLVRVLAEEAGRKAAVEVARLEAERKAEERSIAVAKPKASGLIANYENEEILSVVAASLSKQVSGVMVRESVYYLKLQGGGFLTEGATFPAKFPKLGIESYTIELSDIRVDGYELKLNEVVHYVKFVE